MMGLEERASMLGSTLVEFNVDYQNSNHRAIGDAVHSDAISVGGYMWRMNCYPAGVRGTNKGEYVSFFLELLNKSSSVDAIFMAWLKGNDQLNSTSVPRVLACVFDEEEDEWGCQFISQIDIKKCHLTEGRITFVCAIMVVSEGSVPVLPSDLGKQLGRLLDSKDGTDVSFNIDGEIFYAHRTVLSARSPVFKVMALLQQHSESCFSSCTLTRCLETMNLGTLPMR